MVTIKFGWIASSKIPYFSLFWHYYHQIMKYILLFRNKQKLVVSSTRTIIGQLTKEHYHQQVLIASKISQNSQTKNESLVYTFCFSSEQIELPIERYNVKASGKKNVNLPNDQIIQFLVKINRYKLEISQCFIYLEGNISSCTKYNYF